MIARCLYFIEAYFARLADADCAAAFDAAVWPPEDAS